MENAGQHVLIVDDHTDLADSVCELLNLSGHDATAVYCAEDAIEVCRARQPQVAILDFRIGTGINGIELLGVLRRESPDLIAILMTSDLEQNTAVHSLKAGIFDYVRKPAEADEILAAVVKALAAAAEVARKSAELRKLGDEAEAAESQRRFLLSLGSEIREPLSLIMGNAEFLAASAVGREGKLAQIAEDIRFGATTLLERVSLAKELTSAEVADDHENGRLDAAPLLREVRGKLERKALAGRIAIEVRETSAPIHLWAGKQHLRRLLKLFAEGLLSLAAPGATMKLSAETAGRQTILKLSISSAAVVSGNDLAGGFGLALAYAHRLGIVIGLSLGAETGSELTLVFPASNPS